jgi:hypothetical protein
MDKPTTRGFASPKMTPDRRREISQLGGRSVAKEKRAFSANPDLAKQAGRLGGFRRREANLQEIELLRESADGSIMRVPVEASGRTWRKVDRLVRLGYWFQAIETTTLTDSRPYMITHAGKEFLAWVETPEGKIYLMWAAQKRTRKRKSKSK